MPAGHVDSTKQSNLVNNLVSGAVADPELLEAVILDHATQINENYDKEVAHEAETVQDDVHGLGAFQFGSRPYTSSGTKTYYIDSVNGNDANDGLTAGTAFKTWAKAFSKIPYFLAHTHTIYIVGNLAETLNIGQVVCAGGRLLLIGETAVPSDHQVGAVNIRGVVGQSASGGGGLTQDSSLFMRHLHATGQISVIGSTGVLIRDCEPRNTDGVGISAQHSTCYLFSNNFGTDVVQNAIYAQLSRVFSVSNSGNAKQYGLHALAASTIGKSSTQPTGTTANEFTANGGVIR